MKKKESSYIIISIYYLVQSPSKSMQATTFLWEKLIYKRKPICIPYKRVTSELLLEYLLPTIFLSHSLSFTFMTIFYRLLSLFPPIFELSWITYFFHHWKKRQAG